MYLPFLQKCVVKFKATPRKHEKHASRNKTCVITKENKLKKEINSTQFYLELNSIKILNIVRGNRESTNDFRFIKNF